MTLTKADITERLLARREISRIEAKGIVESFFEVISASLERGEPVKLSGFGNFELRNKRQRPGRNPKTGEDVAITARRVATFKPGKKLRSRVSRSHIEEKAAENTASVAPFLRVSAS